MSMNNHSVTNEKLICKIRDNLEMSGKRSKISILYWSIINLTILPKLQGQPGKLRDHNLAIALLILRKKLPYNLACFCVRNNACDSLYHAINDYKYHINSDFYTIFEGV